MQSKCVQEAFQHIHTQKHSQRDAEPSSEEEVQSNAVHWKAHLQPHRQCLGEKYERQLLVSKRQCPDTQVGGRVRHGSKHELNGFDHLMNEYLAKFKLLTVVA